MKENLQKMKDGWASLATREKRFVSIGGLLALVFIIYQWIWSPYVNSVVEMRSRIQTQQKFLAWMQTTDAQLAKLKGGEAHTQAEKTSPILLMALLQKEINHTGLSQSLTQLKQSGSDAVDVQFAKVDFDKMINLVITTLKEQNVTISQLSINSGNEAGVVNASLILKIA